MQRSRDAHPLPHLYAGDEDGQGDNADGEMGDAAALLARQTHVDAMRDKIVANMAALRQRREANVNDSALCADCDHQIAELRNLLTLCESAVEDFGEIRRDAAVLRQFAERARGGERDSILTKFEQLESVYDQLVAETEQLKRQRAEHAHDVLVVRQCDEAILACETRIELLWLELDEAMLELEAGAE